MMRYQMLAAGVLAGTAIFAAELRADLPDLESTRLTTGLTFPTAITHVPNDESRLFIAEKPGRIRILDLETNQLLSTPFLDITSTVTSGNTLGDERGLLGVAFHPDFEENGHFYVNYTTGGTFNLQTVVRRYTVSANDPNVADLSSAQNVIGFSQPFSNHNGGWIGFGLDGYLYIAVGDGGSGGDPQNNAQNTNNLLGNMLRIDVDNVEPGESFGIPDDNPFKGVSGFRDEIWSYGLRNPWKNSFDRQTGDLWIGDVGQNLWEEINFQPASSEGGENYGWRCYEGFASFNTTGCPPQNDLVFPIHSYAIFGASGANCAITGGYVYRGCDIPGLQGQYIYGDFCSARIWALDPESRDLPYDPTTGGSDPAVMIQSQLSPSIEGASISWVSAFGEDARGELYIAQHSPGAIFKIIPAGGPQPNPDLNCDGVVNVFDLLLLLENWGSCPGGADCPGDLNEDGTVNVFDLLLLLENWG